MNRFEIARGERAKKPKTPKPYKSIPKKTPGLGYPILRSMFLRMPGGQEVKVHVGDLNLTFSYTGRETIAELSASFYMTQEQTRILMGR